MLGETGRTASAAMIPRWGEKGGNGLMSVVKKFGWRITVREFDYNSSLAEARSKKHGIGGSVVV